MGTPHYKLHLWWKVPAYPHHWQNNLLEKVSQWKQRSAVSNVQLPHITSSMRTVPIKYGAREECFYKISSDLKHLRFAYNQTPSSRIRLSSSHQQPECDLKITAIRIASIKFAKWCPHTAFRSLLCTFPSLYRHNSYSMFHLTDILTQQIKLHDTKETRYHTGVCWGIMQIFLIDLHAFTLHTTRELFYSFV
jgi:hypothetical protein